MRKVTINPNQLPELETKDGIKYLRFQNNDTDIVLFCRLSKTALLIHYAERVFFDDGAQDWDGKEITPAEGLKNFGETHGFDPVNGKIKPFELIPAPTAPDKGTEGPAGSSSAGSSPALYRKIRFMRGTDKTAGLVVTEDQFKNGFSELSRLYPISEAGKMQFFQYSPAFADWETAFNFNLETGAQVTTKQVNH